MKPALFIIPGSFSPTTYYIPLRERTAALGYESFILPLQTVGIRPAPAPTMYDDAAFINAEVKKLVDRGREVVLLAHSYGGVPTSQSTKGLTVSERADAGLKGGIRRLIYTAAFAPPKGGNLVKEFGGLPPAFQQAVDDKQPYFSRNLSLATVNETFSDLSPEAAAIEIQNFEEQAVAGYFDNITWPGYDNVSTTYIHTLDDHLVPLATQNVTIERLKASSPSFELREIHSGHCPMVTKLDDFVEIVKEILEAEC